ncbi:MAG: phospholipid carrier-dependent glycosyltransferase [Candidatus Moranbacteria bacterium]|nr:phospholipid carrier-dependent glycosyltransferase [Candidatus Moranbacteria bacterium]
MNTHQNFLQRIFGLSERRILQVLGGLFFINSFIFVAKQVPELRFLGLHTGSSNTLIYFLFLLLGTLLTLHFFIHPTFSQRPLLVRLKSMSLALLPSILLIQVSISLSKNFHFVFQLGSGLALIFAISVLFRVAFSQDTSSPHGDTLRVWFKRQGAHVLFLVLILTGIFFSFGYMRLGQYAAVDEPLWLYGRITKFWNNVSEQEWQKTDVSDKPGITVAILSGAGLWQYDPEVYDDTRSGGEVFVNKSLDMEAFFKAFRLPLLIFVTLLLPLVYFLLERLIGRGGAILSYTILTTSPILIGVTKIINPDALLWLFTTLSLLSFLVFQKRAWYRYLFLSGFFLGLALLTKYIANIVYIYLLALLFLEYLYHPKKNALIFTDYLRKSLLQIAFVIFVSLATFYLILPANWLDPKELVQSTLLSQAFVKVAPLFVFLITFILLDQFFNRARITLFCLEKIAKIKHSLTLLVSALFFGGIIFTLYNTWTKMSVYPFMELIASPKTISDKSDLLGVFLTNFYPMVFGLTPVALLGVLLVAYFIAKKDALKNSGLRFAFYASIFVLVYYLGATVNGVASIIRYQIIIFPLVALISGIGLLSLARVLETKLHYKKNTFVFFMSYALILVGTGTLARTYFPLSYASELLPKEYYIDLKDMGPGSYEIAQKLNALPDAQNILIWTDKDGVCQFFVGRCKRGNNKEVITDQTIDYVVISSAREVRTGHMIRSSYSRNPEAVVPIHLFYEENNPAFEVKINNRPSHYVRAFKYDKANAPSEQE